MKFRCWALVAMMLLGLAGPKAMAATSEEDYRSGLAYYAQKQYPGALAFFRLAVQADPNNWRAYQGMGYCLGQTGAYAQALDACEKSLGIHPDNPPLRDYTERLRAQLLTAPPIPSAPAQIPTPDNRMDKRFGLYLSLIGDPVFCFGGLNAAYNVTPYLRLTGGLGYCQAGTEVQTAGGSTEQTGTATGISVGAGAKFLVPGWEFSPTLGLNLSEFIISGLPSLWTSYSQGTAPSSLDYTFFYPNLGFDYQAKDGFNLGLGVNFIFFIGTPQNVTTDVSSLTIPYLNLGKFF